MKKISSLAQVALVLVVVLSFSVKNRNDLYTDFSNLQPFLELRTPVNNIAGLAFFPQAALTGSGDNDTARFYVNLASNNVLDRDLNVSLGVSTSALDSYNADPENTVKYELMPDDLYIWDVRNVTIKAGERIAEVLVVFHSSSFDKSKNYMLPVSILDGDGISVSANQGIIWYHAIGNCFAGTYTTSGTRTGYSGGRADGIIAFEVDLADYSPKTFLPVDPENVVVDYGDLGGSGWQYVISVDCATNEVTDVQPNDAMASGIKANSFKLLQPVTYDAATKTLHIVSGYTNSSGNDRDIDETFVKE